MLVIPFMIVAGIIACRLSYYPMLLVLLSIPRAAKAIRRVWAGGDSAAQIRQGAAKGRYPLNSIRLHMQFSLLLILGCALVALFAALTARDG
jgi:1,4-dihydroxy-2-naphthoate octaprenyltransferase